MSITASAHRANHPDRFFFTGMALACALTVFVGFAPTYYLGRTGLLPLSPLIHIHAAVFTIWIALLVIQTALVSACRVDVHRRLGAVGAAVAAVMFVLGVMAAISSLKRGVSAPGLDPRVLFAIPISSILTFAVLVTGAVIYRRDAATHKRLMLMGNVSLISAAIGRVVLMIHFPVMTLFLFTDFFVVAAILYDLVSRGRIHRATILGGGLIVLKPLMVLGARTGPWLALADALR
jgi:uncharacterized membrane protein YozB (DUF420 family)